MEQEKLHIMLTRALVSVECDTNIVQILLDNKLNYENIRMNRWLKRGREKVKNWLMHAKGKTACFTRKNRRLRDRNDSWEES